jgi:hypothetical protein
MTGSLRIGTSRCPQTHQWRDVCLKDRARLRKPDQLLLQVCQAAVLRIAANIAKLSELLGPDMGSAMRRTQRGEAAAGATASNVTWASSYVCFRPKADMEAGN